MDLMALSIFFAAFVICSLLVFFISVYGTKEVTFEENLKATHGVKKSSKDSKKKAKKASKGAEASEIIPNTKVTQKRFKSRKKKTDQVLDQASLEPTEENEIIPDTSETDSTRNDLVTADFNEEISVKEIEQEEVEKPVEEPKRPETPIEVVEEEPEPEIEAEPEEVVKVEPPVVEEVKQESSAEATPKKSKKKQKIKIGGVGAAVEETVPEVVEPVEVPEPVPVEVVQEPVVQQQQQQPKKESKKNKKSNKPKDELILQPKTSLDDLLQLVMKTPLDDLEIQNVIDLLLTRRTGSSSSNYHDWVDASDKKNETKILQGQLAEKEALLAEETAKVKSITDKMAALRVDLNGARNTTVQSQRYVNELEAQRKQLEARLHAEIEGHQRYVATLRGQVQYHATRAQGLQASLDNVQQQQAAIDPTVLAELEALRNIQMTLESEKIALESECGSLHSRLNSKTEECQKLQQNFNQKSGELDEAMTNLNKASENFATLEQNNSSVEELKRVNHDLETQVNELTSTCMMQKDELSRLSNEESGSEELKRANQDLEAKVNELNSLCTNQKNELSRLTEQESDSEELKRANQDLEAKVNELSSNCLKQKTELARLADENERISDQLASMAERPAAEGQEANGQESFNGNGNHHAPSDDIKNTEQENPWQQKYLAISQEHEQILKEKDVILQKMHTVESDYKSQVSKLESDLEDQRAKNNELRSKNWKTVEALNSVEQNYQKLLKSNQNQKPAGSDTKALEAAILDSEASQKDFLQRLFPTVASQAKEKHSDWLEAFAVEVNKWKDDTASKASALATEAANKASESASEDKLQKLEGQVEHYKAVLAETESMLNQLQASVESEESGWKSQFSKKEAQLEKLQRQLEAVEAKNTAMEASLNSLNSVEEMETKLRELQEKLAVEEADKIQLQNKLHQSLDSEMEVKKLQDEIDTEVRLRKDLDEKVAKMNQLLTTGQEALQQEKKTVEMLRQQIVSQTPTKGSSLATNGQDEASVVE